MSEFKLGICFLDEEENIITKRVVGTNWSVIEQDLTEKYMREEVAKILVENLKLQLNSEVVENMLEEIKERRNK